MPLPFRDDKLLGSDPNSFWFNLVATGETKGILHPLCPCPCGMTSFWVGDQIHSGFNLGEPERRKVVVKLTILLRGVISRHNFFLLRKTHSRQRNNLELIIFRDLVNQGSDATSLYIWNIIRGMHTCIH